MSFDKLESKIGLTFANRNLLTEAFTHGSIRGKRQSRDSETYRRLEFLGDALLRLAVSESVFRDSDGNVRSFTIPARSSYRMAPLLARPKS